MIEAVVEVEDKGKEDKADNQQAANLIKRISDLRDTKGTYIQMAQHPYGSTSQINEEPKDKDETQVFGRTHCILVTSCKFLPDDQMSYKITFLYKDWMAVLPRQLLEDSSSHLFLCRLFRHIVEPESEKIRKMILFSALTKYLFFRTVRTWTSR